VDAEAVAEPGAYMGTRARPWSTDAECRCFKALSSSRGASLSMGGIAVVVVALAVM
jgi:hypothetical protein